MCLKFFEERKFYASRASKVKLVLKLLALDAAKKARLKNTRHFLEEDQNKSFEANGKYHHAQIDKFKLIELHVF